MRRTAVGMDAQRLLDPEIEDFRPSNLQPSSDGLQPLSDGLDPMGCKVQAASYSLGHPFFAEYGP